MQHDRKWALKFLVFFIPGQCHALQERKTGPLIVIGNSGRDLISPVPQMCSPHFLFFLRVFGQNVGFAN